jgi:hypothetical protein
MNSDLHENAAWRAFGMLDADEATSFDEAVKKDPALKMACQEMDFLSAAVAVSSSMPIAPQAGQLEKLHLRLGLNQPRRTNWLGISGWAAAAALTLILASQRVPHFQKSTTKTSEPSQHSVLKIASQRAISPATEASPIAIPQAQSPTQGTSESPIKTKSSGSDRSYAMVESRHLIQKIEVLQEKVEQLQSRERQRLEVQPDVAWPIVMRMRPPQATAEKDNDILAAPTLTETLGDALAANDDAEPATSIGIPNQKKNKEQLLASNDSLPETTPISIYDPATGKGVLVTPELPPSDEGTKLILIADTENGPYVVGTIPSNGKPSQKFDYELPATMIPLGMSVSRETTLSAGQAPVTEVLFNSSPLPSP